MGTPQGSREQPTQIEKPPLETQWDALYNGAWGGGSEDTMKQANTRGKKVKKEKNSRKSKRLLGGGKGCNHSIILGSAVNF